MRVPEKIAENQAWRLENECGFAVVQIDHVGSSFTWLEIYFPNEIEALLAARVIRATLPEASLHIRHCAQRDWTRFWRKHFHPTKVGRHLCVTPAWTPDGIGDPLLKNIIIDPGLSFGTGDHFTTRFCLEMIDDLASSGHCSSLLDVGTGSGVLAIAAALLGTSRIFGIDYDPICIREAKENAQRNKVGHAMEFQQIDITQSWPFKKQDFDVVCANLFANLLIREAASITATARRFVVLSGVLEEDIERVSEAFIDCNAREIVRDGDGEWCGLLFATS